MDLFVSSDQIQKLVNPKRITKKNISFGSTFTCRITQV